MKTTGIVRKVDELGRIVVPIELRRILDLNIKDPVEIFVERDKIILQKYKPYGACAVTGEIAVDNVTLAGGKLTLSQKGMHILLKELEEHVKSL
ncbi:AbrB/MazE/SpoVT family DNA-binding domain-containing protein [Bacillus songklensis]|uniref:AbrB/MazE/SpoVT family DNA-binding domain-containing protein n=1 Tax=Bacillus songklensis TaxID=1069116 RepID=A0ABV8B010_9BACI